MPEALSGTFQVFFPGHSKESLPQTLAKTVREVCQIVGTVSDNIFVSKRPGHRQALPETIAGTLM